jgi:hypothetical protein
MSTGRMWHSRQVHIAGLRTIYNVFRDIFAEVLHPIRNVLALGDTT